MSSLPSAFIWRRLHSFTGVCMVLFLMFHLLTNSQAALLFGEDGIGFIRDVNLIHAIPYLIVIEVFLLGVPFLIHMAWGMHYLFSSEPNSFPSDGSKPALPEYYRNKAYTLQRLTSWILLFGIIAHVFHMRIYNYPTEAQLGSERSYMQRVEVDPGLYTVAARLDVKLMDKADIEKEKQLLAASPLDGGSIAAQLESQREKWLRALEARPLEKGEVIAVSPDFGTATLLLVRDTFKSPIMALVYSLFVLAASYHAFNGLWTALITWGVTLNPASQNISQKITLALMLLVAFLGLAAIWGTYFFNLRT